MDKVREEVLAKWTPDKVEEACGVPEAQVFQVAEMMAKNRPSTLVWCMGQTQHTIGNAIVRASCIVQLALGNIGVSGGGANIFRGHDNVQGATDVGPNPDSLPGYYGLATGSWKYWAGVVKLPMRRFSAMLRLNNPASWKTTAMARRSEVSLTSRMSCPSTVMRP
jgi:formate dehydrogenase major subunit